MGRPADGFFRTFHRSCGHCGPPATADGSFSVERRSGGKQHDSRSFPGVGNRTTASVFHISAGGGAADNDDGPLRFNRRNAA